MYLDKNLLSKKGKNRIFTSYGELLIVMYIILTYK